MIAQGHDTNVVPVQAANSQTGTGSNTENFPDRWAPFAQMKPQTDKPFHSIFATNNSGAINSMVQKTWGTLGSNVPPQIVAQLEQSVQARGGPFVSLTSPGWVRPVSASGQGTGQPLDLTAFVTSRR